MNSYMYGQQNQQLIIQQLFLKIESLLEEIQKLTNFSNQLITNLQMQETQYTNLKRQFNDVWACLTEKQKIWFNLKNNTQHYTLSNEAFIMSGLITDIKSRVSEIKQMNFNQNEIMYPKKHCQSCQEKDYMIANLKAQIQKQAQILQKLQKEDQPSMQYQTNQSYQHQRIHTDSFPRYRVASQKLFESNLSTATSPLSKY